MNHNMECKIFNSSLSIISEMNDIIKQLEERKIKNKSDKDLV